MGGLIGSVFIEIEVGKDITNLTGHILVIPAVRGSIMYACTRRAMYFFVSTHHQHTNKIMNGWHGCSLSWPK